MFVELWFKMLKGTACEDYGRHCAEEGEYNSNVFYRPSNTLPVCETDASGNFGTGTLDVSSNDSTEDDVEHVVHFEYQVQTTLNLTVARLNAADSPLYAIEKAISDTVLAGLFSGSQCTEPPAIKSRDETRQRTRQLLRTRHRSLQLYYSDQLSGLRSAPTDQSLPGAAGGACVCVCAYCSDLAWMDGTVSRISCMILVVIDCKPDSIHSSCPCGTRDL